MKILYDTHQNTFRDADKEKRQSILDLKWTLAIQSTWIYNCLVDYRNNCLVVKFSKSRKVVLDIPVAIFIIYANISSFKTGFW